MNDDDWYLRLLTEPTDASPLAEFAQTARLPGTTVRVLMGENNTVRVIKEDLDKATHPGKKNIFAINVDSEGSELTCAIILVNDLDALKTMRTVSLKNYKPPTLMVFLPGID